MRMPPIAAPPTRHPMPHWSPAFMSGSCPLSDVLSAFRIAEPSAGLRPYHPPMADSVIRVVLVDDHDLLRRGIRTMLESEGGIQVVGEASDGTAVLGLVENALP